MPSLLEVLCVLLEFLPQVFVLYFVLTLVEKSGLLSLIAKFFHLPIQNMLPVCLSFSCTTLAVCAARECPARHRLTYFMSFIPCTAQLPLLMLLLFSVLKFPFWSIILVYLVGVVLGLLVVSFVPKQSSPLVTEPLKLHFPNVWHCLRDSLQQTLVFAKKIFIAFAVSAFVIVILARFSFAFKYVTNPEDSILFSICGVLSPIFRPIGLHNPALICALLFGIIAKESAVSVLLFFPSIMAELTLPVALSLVVFYAFYPKCMSAQAAICSSCNVRTSAKIFVTNLLVAYGLAFVVYTVCGLFI